MRHYASRYPRNGKIAILCEGDLAGYEADILESWTALHPELGLVDVWPCGTKTAIYGLADAIGRATRVCVIEDRDHRKPEFAAKQCRRNKKNRESRGVQIGFWKTWKRNEIENYLIEPSIVIPVFADAFGTSEDNVKECLQSVLTTTSDDQALQHTLSEFRSVFPNGESEVGGVPRKECRPRWEGGALQSPSQEKVSELLAAVLTDSVKKLAEERHPKVDDFLKGFDDKCKKWRKVKLEDNEWRTDWAGKEVLLWLRIKMAAEFGWPDFPSSGRVKVEWEALNQSDSGELDRRIERVLQPRLAKALLHLLNEDKEDDSALVSEWRDLIDDLRGSSSPDDPTEQAE